LPTMDSPGNVVYRVGDVEVDTSRGCIRLGQQEHHLRQQAFQVLVYLLERHERLVTKEELMDRVWKDTAVTDDVLVQCVMDIRKAIGDDSRNPRFVRTIPKVGYRFIGSVELQPAGGVVTAETEEATSVEVEIEEETPDGDLPRAVSEALPALPPALVTRRRCWRWRSDSASSWHRRFRSGFANESIVRRSRSQKPPCPNSPVRSRWW